MASAAVKALYEPKMPAKRFNHLTSTDIITLTQILCHAPHPLVDHKSPRLFSYMSMTREQIKALPRHLLSVHYIPLNGAQRAMEKFGSSLPQPMMQWLNASTGPGRGLHGHRVCALHAPLSLGLMAEIFRWIKKDVCELLPNYLERLHNARALEYPHKMLFSRLDNLAEIFEDEPRPVNPLNRDLKASDWIPQPDGCRACALARIGGDLSIITMLRAGALARCGETKLYGSKRMEWYQAWINVHGDKEAGKAMELGSKIGKEVHNIGKSLKMEEDIEAREAQTAARENTSQSEPNPTAGISHEASDAEVSPSPSPAPWGSSDRLFIPYPASSVYPASGPQNPRMNSNLNPTPKATTSPDLSIPSDVVASTPLFSKPQSNVSSAAFFNRQNPGTSSRSELGRNGNNGINKTIVQANNNLPYAHGYPVNGSPPSIPQRRNAVRKVRPYFPIPSSSSHGTQVHKYTDTIHPSDSASNISSPSIKNPYEYGPYLAVNRPSVARSVVRSVGARTMARSYQGVMEQY
ncbi:hypothetical protein M501DRAFT_1054543 [Patellaria atrata CBS 101060]|uniref:Uncharacterized protein n=1 Tax=Patellaria atrata CBS 101060 TaxID=1346257 RepID=A0A9P4SL51_9PEZI|nr:hypothetical protein M501DRAFT_1054543 [Patellaria atrata CBS 101060]